MSGTYCKSCGFKDWRNRDDGKCNYCKAPIRNVNYGTCSSCQAHHMILDSDNVCQYCIEAMDEMR